MNRTLSPRRRAWAVEALDGRILLSSWVGQGPDPIYFDTQAIAGMEDQFSPSAGAVEALAPDPSNPDVLYAGTVNGGVWETTDATGFLPTWTPLTDYLPSLAISDLAFSPTDPTHRTLYAATGSYSSAGDDGGPGAGIYKTTDGGATWTVLGSDVFGNRRIRNVVPTALDGGRVVLAGTRFDTTIHTGGVYRSGDGGATWALISGTGGLPLRPVSFLTGDPGEPHRFYAAVQETSGTNIYRSDDGGLTWAPKLVGLSGNDEPGTRIELAIHNDPGHNVIYAAVLTPAVPVAGQDTLRGDLAGLFRSTDQGEHWTAMSLPGDVDGGIFLRGEAGDTLHLFAMAADPTDPDVVFVSGSSEEPPFPKANGTYTRSDRSFRGDAAQPPELQWTALDGDGAGGTAPHADSRDFKFDARGDLLQADDGGIYRLINPNNTDGAAARRWVSVVGPGLANSELYSVAYDDLNHSFLAGAQDNGCVAQILQQIGAQSYQLWEEGIGGDGVGVQVDTTSAPGLAFYYMEIAHGEIFYRFTLDGADNVLGAHRIGLIVDGTNGKSLPDVDDSTLFDQPYELNAVDPTRMLIGTSFLYESFDRGDHLDRLAGGAEVGPVTALAYGGWLKHVANPDVAYVGTSGPDKLLLRTAAGDAFTPLTAYPGGTPQDIALDPQDWRRAYVVSNNQVWATSDAGRSWLNITGNLDTLTPATRVGAGGSYTSLRTVAVISRSPGLGDDIVLVGGFGGVYAIRHPGLGRASLTWSKLGEGFPTVVVTDVRYDAKDDIVIAGTLGRGVWSLSHPRRSLRPADQGDDIDSLELSPGRGPERPGSMGLIDIGIATLDDSDDSPAVSDADSGPADRDPMLSGLSLVLHKRRPGSSPAWPSKSAGVR
jgi:photosystem II stability/assembly factor-like uncharacterized protein